MERQDHYYRILGIDRSASRDEVKNAYRRLARRFHPDVSSDPDAERKFKAVAEAYRMLKARETGALDRRDLHVHGEGEHTNLDNPLDVWFALFLWPAWTLFWPR